MSNTSKQKSPTASMKLDVLAIDEDLDVINSIEVLKAIKSFRKYDEKDEDKMPKILTRNQIAIYTVILYSDDSILNLRNPLPLDQRKEQALTYAGVKKTPEIEKMLMGLGNPEYLKMIHDFLIDQNHIVWTELVTTEQQYEEAVYLRLKPSGGTDKSALQAVALKKQLREECKVMVNDIKHLYRQFYADHDDVKDKIKELPLSLETVAKGAKDVF